jgi:HNH endonuclease/AP2 domain
MKEIELTQGKIAVVADHMFDWLNQWKWYAHKDHNTWYAMRGVRKPVRKALLMHRVILDAPHGVEVDHVDGNGLHNWPDNLRLATHSRNMSNRRIQSNNTSGYKGVSWDARKRKWQAILRANGRQKRLGYFIDLIAAARAYDAAARDAFGEFARCNFPDSE